MEPSDSKEDKNGDEENRHVGRRGRVSKNGHKCQVEEEGG